MGLKEFLYSLIGLEKQQKSRVENMDAGGSVSKDFFYDVMDTQSSVFLFFTKDVGWIGANSRFFETFNYSSIEDFRDSNSSFRDFIEFEDDEVFADTDFDWLEYIRRNKKDGYHVKIRDRQMRLRAYSFRCNLLHHRGHDLHTVELSDITALREAEKKSIEVEEMKSRFLGNIGHEFRTPMNGILGFVDLLEKSHPTESQVEYIRMIHASAQNLMYNIESLLDLAQMQGGRLKLNTSEFGIVSELEKIAKQYFHEGLDKGVHVSFYIDPKLPTYIVGDVRKLKQILGNLISNAVKFSQKDDMVFVDVKLLKQYDDDRCDIGFGIRDTGEGIAKGDIARITQPFVSGRQADNRLGVGLSLSKGLIEMMGGELKISSEEDVGSQFNFVLTFPATTVQMFDQIKNKRAKVALFDKERISDAGLLTDYLRSFGVQVAKVHVVDEDIFENTDMVYIVAKQEQSSWMMKLGSYSKKCRVVMLLEHGEKLHSRTASIVDYTITKPILPSKISIHLTQIFHLPLPVRKQKKYKKEGVSALVVEDNLINQRLIKILLQEYNLKVTTASDGEQAVRLCRNYSFDIVFMDIDMPVKDGIAATREIKQLGGSSEMPIVALTAMAMQGDRERIMREGLDDYLSKPLTREKLEFVLEKYLKVKA
ncbi:MAG: hypothetical protein B5M52_02990 [Helicobacteraceae bacterium 4484_230]|nr:MAG: hypothetical protein B5M52_02990 [Helicobacteraceae bacterium 4484_230]